MNNSHGRKTAEVKDVIAISEKNITCFYIINFNPEGWIITTADGRISPILAFNFVGSFDINKPQVASLIDFHKSEISYALEHGQGDAKALAEWQLLIENKEQKSGISKIVVPLLTSHWDQFAPYNAKCPILFGQPTLVGCAATSVSQIMHYWKWPINGSGSHQSTWTLGTCPDNGFADYENTYYEWNKMPDKLYANSGTDSINAVALLCRHFGIAQNMRYGNYDAQSLSSEQDIAPNLQSYFKYRANYFASIQGIATMMNYMSDDINLGRPVQINGFGASGGHAWVCDGYMIYNGLRFYHFNFGWGGVSDGYYRLYQVNTGTYSFNSHYRIVHGIRPNKIIDIYPQPKSQKIIVQQTHINKFVANAVHNGGLPVSFEWKLNNTVISTIPDTCSVQFNDLGLHQLSVKVSQNSNPSINETYIWEIEVVPQIPDNPSPPLNLQASAVERYVQLLWEAPEGYAKSLIRYNIYWHNGAEWVKFAETTELSFLDNYTDWNTEYKYYVTATFDYPNVVESGPSNVVTVITDPILFSLNESFENNEIGNLPYKWQQVSLSGASIWKTSNSAGFAASGANYCSILTKDDVINDWLILPCIRIDTLKNPNNLLSYKIRSKANFGAPEKYQIKIPLTPNPQNFIDFSIPIILQSQTYVQETFDISDLRGLDIYFAFVALSDDPGRNYMLLDDVKIGNFYGPQSLQAQLLEDSVRLSWLTPNVPNGNVLVRYEIYRDNYFKGSTFSKTFTDYNVKDKQTYGYTVRAVFNHYGYSDPSNTEFVTISKTSGSLKETFENTFASFIPELWTKYNSDGDAESWIVRTSSLWAHQGNNYIRIVPNTTAPGNDDWLVTPRLHIKPGAGFSFWARTNQNNKSLKVMVSITDNLQASFVTQAFNQNINSEWTLYNINMNAWVGQKIYCAFVVTGTNDATVLIDDVELRLPVTGIEIPNQVSMIKNSTYQLQANVLPDDASNQKITWQTSDGAIAIVNADGLITAKLPGIANIIAVADDGGFSDTCQVFVNDSAVPVTDISLIPNSLVINLDSVFQFEHIILPELATNKKVFWASSNDTIITIDDSGLAHANKPGSAFIGIITEDGSHTDFCDVIVIDNRIPVNGIGLNYNNICVSTGAIFTLSATVTPVNATNKNVLWKSANDSVVMVTDGILIPINNGAAYVYAYTHNMEFIDSCMVNVIDAHVIYNQDFNTSGFPAGWTTTNNGSGSHTTDGDWRKDNTTISNGYQNASGGSHIRTRFDEAQNGCVLTYNNTTTPLNTVGYTNITIIWGARRSIGFNNNVVFQWSADGVNWNTVNYTDATYSTNNNGWMFVNSSTPVTLPKAAENIANLRLRWSTSSIVNSTYRIDDIRVTGIPSVPVSAVSINPSAVLLKVNETYPLSVAISPITASNPVVSWISENSTIATVSANGLVSAVAKGTAVIKVTSDDGGHTSTANVYVTDELTPVLMVSPDELSLDYNANSSANFSIISNTSWNITCNQSWLSFSATSGNGIQAITIYATENTSPIVRTAIINVEAPGLASKQIIVSQNYFETITAVVVNYNNITLATGTNFTLTASAIPYNASNDSLIWSSLNSGIATVDKGIVTGIAGGTTKIIVGSHALPALADTCTVTVISTDILYSQDYNASGFAQGWFTTRNGSGTYNTSDANNDWLKDNTNTSTGYPGASGSGHFRTRTDKVQSNSRLTYNNTSTQLSTVGKTNLKIIWGARRSQTFTNPVVLEWSADGSNWNAVTFSDAVYTTENNGWMLVNNGNPISLPAGAENVANLRLRWTTTFASSQNYRIDDLKVTGITKVSVTGLSVIPATASMYINEYYPLGVELFPSNATNIEINWSSVDTSIAVVSDKGVIFSKKPGTVKIYATTADGGYKDSCLVSVQNMFLNINPATLDITELSGNANLNVYSNTKWSISSDKNWISSSTSTGEDSALVNLNYLANTVPIVRQAKIVVAGNRVARKILTVNQNGVAPVLTINQDTLYVDSAANSTVALNIISNLNWTIQSDQNWLSPEKTTGSGNDTVLLVAQRNVLTTERAALITIDGGALSRSIVVIQHPGSQYLSVSKTSITIGANNNSTATFSISANVDWSISSNQTWVQPNSNSGSNNAIIVLTAFQNPTAATRNAIITVTNNNITCIINVTQNAGQAALTVMPDTVFLSALATDSSLFYIQSNVAWNISCNQSWVFVNKTSGSLNDTITLTAQENTSISARQALLFIDAGLISDTILVFQQAAAAFLFATPTTLPIGYLANSTNTFAILSNTSWIISDTSTWLQLSDTAGAGNDSILVTAAENTLLQTRTAAITITAAGIPNRTVMVIQNATNSILQVSQDSVYLQAGINNSGNFIITSNLSWQINNPATWLHLNNLTGSGNDTILIYADENLMFTPRSVVLTIDAPGAAPLTIVVFQHAAIPVLNVSATNITLGYQANSTSSFNIISNLSWQIENIATWLQLNDTSGTGNDSIILTALENTSFSQRTTNLTISASGVSSRIITVIQNPTVPYLSVLVDTLHIENCAGCNANFDIASNTGWQLSTSVNWLQLSDTAGTGNSNITVIADSNYSLISRNAIITISGANVSSQTVYIIQNPAQEILIVSPDTIFIGYEANSCGAFQVFSNVSWLVQNNASWLHLDTNSGSGTDSIAFCAEANTTLADRTANLTISAGITITRNVWVVQKSNVGIAEISNSNQYIITPNPTTGKFKIHTPVPENGINTISIMHQSGKIVRVIENINFIDKTGIEFDFLDLPAGIYFINLKNKKNVVKLKFIKI